MTTDGDVWVQCGKIGVRVPADEGLTTAGELIARGTTNVAAIHEEDCRMAIGLMDGGGTCSCEPFLIGLDGEHVN